MEYNIENAVNYHYNNFPPKHIDFLVFIQELVGATDALARFDQMLKNLHNTEILLAPLRNQEAVISSRIEGTISTMDEILQYEADHDTLEDTSVRSDVINYLIPACIKECTISIRRWVSFFYQFLKTNASAIIVFRMGSKEVAR